MFATIKQDIYRYKFCEDDSLWLTFIKALYTHPSFAGILWYRFGHYSWKRRNNPIYFMLLILNRSLYPFFRLYSGLELSPKAEIGDGLWIGHSGPTVIHPGTIAGRNLTILHGVTIGFADGIPIIGNDVSIGTGATLIGNIKIGDNVIIGAGAVVIEDVQSNCLATGVPAHSVQR